MALRGQMSTNRTSFTVGLLPFHNLRIFLLIRPTPKSPPRRGLHQNPLLGGVPRRDLSRGGVGHIQLAGKF